MNFSTKLRRQNAVLAVALGGVLALAGGCTSMDDGSIELEPTVYAVAPLDLPEDYDAFPTLYVPVAPLDLPDDYGVPAGDGADQVVVASSDSLMVP